jgi:hypothetical protein
MQVSNNYGYEVQSSYRWKLYKYDNIITQGFLDLQFKNLPTERVSTSSEYREYLDYNQQISLYFERELLATYEEYLKLSIDISTENEAIHNIDDQILSTFFSYKKHLYNTLNILSSPVYHKRSTLNEIIFLLSCCCFCCDELCCQHCGYNVNAEKNLISANTTKRHNLVYNIANYLNTIFMNIPGNEIESRFKIEPAKTPVINIFICNEMSIEWISKILSNQLKTQETLVILPFDNKPIQYKIYTHKYPEVRQVDNNIDPTHKIIFTDVQKPERKLILQLHRGSIETILLLSCIYSTETNYLLQIDYLRYNSDVYQFPPTYEEISASFSLCDTENNQDNQGQTTLAEPPEI